MAKADAGVYFPQQPQLGYPVGGVSAPPIQPRGQQEWSTGLCDCFDDLGNCCITCFCPCITFGQIAEIVDKGSSSCGVSGALYGLLCSLTGCQCIYSCFYREKMRGQHSLPASPCGDCLVHCCCEECALCQEYRELKNRGFDMTIGWQGNMERMGGGVQMVPPLLITHSNLTLHQKTHHHSNPNTVLFAISRRKSSPSQLFCRRLENRCSVLCHATRRKPRYDSSDNDDEEEYGHNSEISMLEFYSECNRDVALLVGATVDGEEEQVIIFKGFSSLLSSGTFWDPSKSVLPARAKIRCVDIVRGPFDPSMVEYLETNLTPDDFKTRLKNTLNSDKNT